MRSFGLRSEAWFGLVASWLGWGSPSAQEGPGGEQDRRGGAVSLGGPGTFGRGQACAGAWRGSVASFGLGAAWVG